MVMDKTLKTITITEEKVCKKLENLKVGKTPGCDAICSTILKEVKDVICYDAQCIFDKKLQTN